MDDPRVLRIITVGLVLAALAVVYFLLTGGFSINKPKVNQSQATKVSQSPTPSPASAPSPTASPQAAGQTLPTPAPTSPTSAYDRIAARNQGVVQTLPNTGFPAGVMLAFSVSAIASGLALRKFSK